VRLSPATTRAPLAVLLSIVALVGAIGVGPFAHADTKHLKQQQHRAQHAVSQARASLDEASKQTRHAFQALSRSRRALRSARRDLQVARRGLRGARGRDRRIQAQLQRARARLSQAQRNRAQGQRAVSDQHTTLVHEVLSTYEGGDPQLVGFLSLLGSSTPADMTAKQANNDLVLTANDQALGGLQAAQVLLSVQTYRLVQARDLVAKKKAQAQANLIRMRQYKLQAVSAKMRLAKTVQQRHNAWALGRRARAHDRALVARSKARAARIHHQLMAEIARERRYGGGYKGPTGGLLLRPVNGPITSPYGYRINPVMGYYGLHDGDDFGAACGTPIWAAGNATVLSEYYSSVWGNRLFLNLGLINGQNVTVIYNHLSAYRSSVGQHVARGQVVGLIGTTGWSTGCHTHMTVMVNGVAVDPAPWIG
jgi:murein DD-endopeptidase MepM/ murein hydrolase activator NlpD